MQSSSDMNSTTSQDFEIEEAGDLLFASFQNGPLDFDIFSCFDEDNEDPDPPSKLEGDQESSYDKFLADLETRKIGQHRYRKQVEKAFYNTDPSIDTAIKFGDGSGNCHMMRQFRNVQFYKWSRDSFLSGEVNQVDIYASGAGYSSWGLFRSDSGMMFIYCYTNCNGLRYSFSEVGKQYILECIECVDDTQDESSSPSDDVYISDISKFLMPTLPTLHTLHTLHTLPILSQNVPPSFRILMRDSVSQSNEKAETIPCTTALDDIQDEAPPAKRARLSDI